MRSNSTFMTGLLIGSAVGACAALLYAPRPGMALDAMRHRRSRRAEPAIDDEVEQSFPASDPPSWTAATSTTGTPGTGY